MECKPTFSLLIRADRRMQRRRVFFFRLLSYALTPTSPKGRGSSRTLQRLARTGSGLFLDTLASAQLDSPFFQIARLLSDKLQFVVAPDLEFFYWTGQTKV